MNITQARHPFDAGYDARENGQTRDSNPCQPESSAWNDWLEGWNFADQINNLPPQS